MRLIVKVFACTAIGVCLALFYVWQYVQMAQAGFRIKKEEKDLIRLQKENRGLELRLSRLLMPPNIRRQVSQLRLDLQEPEVWQIVRIQSKPIFFDVGIMDFGDMKEEGVFGRTLISVSAVGTSAEKALLDESP